MKADADISISDVYRHALTCLLGDLAHERQQKVSQLDAMLIESTENQRCGTNLV
jgi:hypothetical protein